MSVLLTSTGTCWLCPRNLLNKIYIKVIGQLLRFILLWHCICALLIDKLVKCQPQTRIWLWYSSPCLLMVLLQRSILPLPWITCTILKKIQLYIFNNDMDNLIYDILEKVAITSSFFFCKQLSVFQSHQKHWSSINSICLNTRTRNNWFLQGNHGILASYFPLNITVWPWLEWITFCAGTGSRTFVISAECKCSQSSACFDWILPINHNRICMRTASSQNLVKYMLSKLFVVNLLLCNW